jgi:viroplasmin and RNaseH domain-containing protein
MDMGILPRVECSEEVLGYKGAVHKKYSSYEQAILDFNSTINSIPSSKPSTSAGTTENAASTTSISYKTVCIIFLCAVVSVMWIKLNKCNNC